MKRIMPWLQLVRLPAVFTAIADIFLGYTLVHNSFEPIPIFLLILLSSCLLYLSGMLWNDFFDREIDAVERASRPIPSGKISVASARNLGILLTLGGLTASFFAGMIPFVVSLILVAFIFMYDKGGKRTPLGPVLMGGCRTLNVLLGTSSGLESVFAQPDAVRNLILLKIALISLGLGVYIAGVTIFAKSEAVGENRLLLQTGSMVHRIGIVMLMLAAYLYSSLKLPFIPIIILFFISVSIFRRTSVAVKSLKPRDIQMSVKVMLMSYIMLCATMVFACGQGTPFYAIATAALLIPTLLIGKLFSMT